MKQSIKLSGIQLENIVKNTSKKVLKEGIHDEVRIAHTLINEKDLNKKLEYWNTLMELGAGENALLDIFIWETNPNMLEIAWDYLSPKMDNSTLRFLSEPMRVKNKIIPAKAQELLSSQKTNIGESKTMKQTIRLTESQLTEVIIKTVRKALKEDKNFGQNNNSANDPKIEKYVGKINELILQAFDSEGNPISVDGYIYDPIIYQNGNLTITEKSYDNPSYKSTQVIEAEDMEYDGIPTLQDINKMYKKVLKNRSTTTGGEGLGDNYNYFAIDKQTNKIVEGWEYNNLDNESIRYYTKSDLQDKFPDRKLSDFAIITRSNLIKKGINPSDQNNWLQNY